MEYQQLIMYQRDVFVEHKLDIIAQLEYREDVNGARTVLGGQLVKETTQGRAFTEELIGIVCSASNLSRAYKQVKRNKGVAGIDNIPVGSFADWFAKEGEHLVDQILRGEYLPSAVKAAEISNKLIASDSKDLAEAGYYFLLQH